MGRPKNSDSAKTVKRIQDAFWELLEKDEYSKITINKLARKANVNRNSIYYHFENVDDIAEKSFKEIIHSEQGVGLVTAALNKFGSDEVYELDNKTRQGMKNLQLMACSNSIWLHQMLKEGIRDNWLRIMQVKSEDLSEIDRLSVDMAFHTAIFIMGNISIADNPDELKAVLETEIGRAIISTMRNIRDKYHR